VDLTGYNGWLGQVGVAVMLAVCQNGSLLFRRRRLQNPQKYP